MAYYDHDNYDYNYNYNDEDEYGGGGGGAGGGGGNHSHHNGSYEDYYYNYDYAVFAQNGTYKWILAGSVIPVCVLGLVANTLSLWVWNTSRKLKTMVLLFQCLGTADNFFLLLSAIRGVLEVSRKLTMKEEMFIFPLLFLAQLMSVHVTTVIGMFRWLAVARPQQVLRKRHVLVTCAALGVWCVLLTMAQVIIDRSMESLRAQQYVAMAVTWQVVGLVAPNLFLLVFSLALLRITWRHQRMQSQKKHRKTTLAVLSIALSSFLACPVAVTAHLLAIFVSYSPSQSAAGCSWTCVEVALGAGDLLQVLNSSVNFFFYFFFASRFRPLLKKAMCGRWTKTKGFRRPSQRNASMSQATTDTGSCTTTTATPPASNVTNGAHKGRPVPTTDPSDVGDADPGHREDEPPPPPTEVTSFV